MRTALYLRSSKDRHDVAIEAQRRELREYATQQGWKVVKECSDTELSGQLDEISRPGYAALKDLITRREVQCVLALESSRITRDPVEAGVFRHLCRKHGVRLAFKNVQADTTTAAGELIDSIIVSIDRLHSRQSAEKGRAGMMQNVLQGFRAGGRAPYGYRLVKFKTDAIRDGKPVLKSRLAPDERSAPVVRRYLKARAAGDARIVAIEKSGIKLSPASLIGLERNAWTYAGFTQWNRREKQHPSRDVPMQRMLPRPEKEWVRSPMPTHEALITPDEAEVICALPVQQQRRTDPTGETLLGGLLYAPDGQRYVMADRGRAYRAGKGRRFNRKDIEREVLARVAAAAEDDKVIERTFNAAQALADQLDDSDPAKLRARLKAIDAQIARLVEAVAEGGGAALGRKIAELETEKRRVADQLAHADETDALRRSLRKWDRGLIQAFFQFAPLSDKEPVQDKLRARLRAVVERVVLDPETAELAVHYALPAGQVLASPRGFEPLLSP